MIAVTGATGTIGSLVARGLRNQGRQVRAFVRDYARAVQVLGSDIEFVAGDFADPASVRRAVSGADALLLSSRNHPQQADYEQTVVTAAADAGVRRIVKLSTVGAQAGSPAAFWDHHGRAETALWQSGVPSVCLRSNFYMSGVLASADSVRHNAGIFLPAAGARIAMIDPADVADVAILTLTTSGHDGHTYELTGPEAIGFDRVAEELSVLTQRPISFVSVPDEAALQAMHANGMPTWIAEQVVIMFGLLREGAASAVTNTVRQLTGREPRSISDFLRRHAVFFEAPPFTPPA